MFWFFCNTVDNIHEPEQLLKPVELVPIPRQKPVELVPLPQPLKPLELLDERIRIYEIISNYFSNKKKKEEYSGFVNQNSNLRYLQKKNRIFDGIYLEKLLMETIRDKIILEKKSKHFQIMYHFDAFNSISINEVVEGDLRFTPLTDDISGIDCNFLINILIQSFISIGSFHNLTGYIHRNCKCANFLYQINPNYQNAYYMYSFNGKTYYLKSCNYNVMISNFEICKIITINDEKLNIEYNKEASNDEVEKGIQVEKMNDIYKVLYLLLADYRRIFKDFTENENITPSSGYECFKKRLNGFYNRLEMCFSKVYFTYTSNNAIDIAKELLNETLLVCLTFFPDIFLEVLPSKNTVLNKIPFELYQETKVTVRKKEYVGEVYVEKVYVRKA